MEYETLTYESLGIERNFIVVNKEDGSFESFEATEENNRYVEFLASLEENN